LGGLGKFSPARSERVFRIATTDHVAASLVPFNKRQFTDIVV
jgi:hypothetical protein